jgi:O-Antigen ligase
VLPDRPAKRPTTPLEAITQTLSPQVPLEDVLRNRPAYWGAAVRMTRESPITGMGAGRYPRLLPQFRSRWIPLDNAHGFFLQLLAEMGILGCAAFIVIPAIVMKRLVRAVRGPDRDSARFALGVLFGAVGYVITLLFGHPLLLPSGQLLWASALAVGVIGSTPATERSRLASGRVTRMRTVAVVLVLGIYGVAAWRTQPPPRQSDAWGYSWGLFPEESGYFPSAFGFPIEVDATAPGPPGTQAARFRWTGGLAIVELQAPTGATHCSLVFTAFLPSRGLPQRVRVSSGGRPQVVSVATSDPHTVRIPLSEDVLDAERRLVVRLEIVPSFRPADLRVSADRRQLGIQLFRPRCA